MPARSPTLYLVTFSPTAVRADAAPQPRWRSPKDARPLFHVRSRVWPRGVPTTYCLLSISTKPDQASATDKGVRPICGKCGAHRSAVPIPVIDPRS